MIRRPLGAVLGSMVFVAASASATTIDFQGIGASTLTSYTTSQGVIFSLVDEDIATGTGTFDPFLRVQASNNQNSDHPGLEYGFNTDGTRLNDEVGGGDPHTHDVLLSDLGTITVNGTPYFEFQIDWNEPNGQGQADERDLLIQQLLFIAGPGNQSQAISNSEYDPGALLGLRFYDLSQDLADNEPAGPFEGFRVWDANHGQGRSDFRIRIPTSLLTAINASATDTNLVLFTRMGNVDSLGAAEATFEEINFRGDSLCISGCTPPPQGEVPEPSTYALIGGGLAALTILKRRVRK